MANGVNYRKIKNGIKTNICSSNINNISLQNNKQSQYNNILLLLLCKDILLMRKNDNDKLNDREVPYPSQCLDKKETCLNYRP